jgi:phytoene desaturase
MAKEPLFMRTSFMLTDKTAVLKEWNRVFLIPLAPGINDKREEYFDKIIDRFETLTGQSIKKQYYI